jgi:lipopolysaccharide/colanic/teichoic acid biosynthesis glycosyltransferase/glycosyltransferase involved in cell wall biosynthesis
MPTNREPNNDWPLVSVVMPVRNEATLIKRCLEAVLAQDYPCERMEVIVADGVSTDGTNQIVQSFQTRHPALKLIKNPGKIVPTGLNLAIAQSHGEVIVRVDGHCEIAGDYVRRCVEHLLNDGVDGVGGPLETIGETSLAKVIAIAMSSVFGVGGAAFRTKTNQTMLTDTVAFPAYWRSIIERAGSFDEELVRNQDDEYNYRLRKMGAKILLAADVRCRYYSRSSLRSLARQYFQYGYWKVRVLQKHSGQMQPRQFVPPLFVGACLLLLVLWPLAPLAGYFLGAVVGSYAIANVTASLLSSRRNDYTALPLMPVVFATLHISYGLGFLTGLVSFWKHWRGSATPSEPVSLLTVKTGMARWFEVALSALGLTVSLPLLILGAVAIVLTSPGSIIFRQQRVGRHGRLFVLYKLRTMTLVHEGPQVTARGDERITRIGRILRRTKVDELPELWNVLKGDMSLVGPRPEVPRYVDLGDDRWGIVLKSRPGITDPVTIRLRDEEALLAEVKGDREDFYVKRLQPFKLQGYIDYLNQRSWWSDLKVLCRTIVVVFWPNQTSHSAQELKLDR